MSSVGVVVAVDLELCDTLCKGLFAERNRQTLVFALERSFCKVASKLNREAVPWFASDDAAVLAAMTCPYGSKVEAVSSDGFKIMVFYLRGNSKPSVEDVQNDLTGVDVNKPTKLKNRTQLWC